MENGQTILLMLCRHSEFKSLQMTDLKSNTAQVYKNGTIGCFKAPFYTCVYFCREG